MARNRGRSPSLSMRRARLTGLPTARRIVTGGRNGAGLGSVCDPGRRWFASAPRNRPGHEPGVVTRRLSHRVRGDECCRSPALAAVRPDGTPVELPEIQVSTGNQNHRFLPNGTGIVYMQSASAGLSLRVATFRDLWLLDLATKAKRHLAHLTGDYTTQSFDITPDSKHDRLRPGERQLGCRPDRNPS